jgi:MFS family permease
MVGIEQCLKFAEFSNVIRQYLLIVVFGLVEVLNIGRLIFEVDALSFPNPEAVDFDLHSDSLLKLKFDVKLSTFFKVVPVISRGATIKSHDSYAAFRVANFRRYYLGNIVMILGLQMQKVAVGWEIYERTHSSLHLGYVGLVQFLPQLLLVVITGHVTDRYNRKYVLMAALAFSALAAIGLALNAASGGTVIFMYVCLLATGTAKAFWMPARAAFLPRIVPMEIFGNAVSWNTTGFEIATMAGPALGGLMIYLFKSPTLVYGVNAVAGFAFVILASRISYVHEKQERTPVTFRTLAAGFQFVRKTNVVLAAMMLDMFGVLLGGATALMPVYAKDILNVGPQGLGWLLAAPSIGAFSMAILQAHRGPMKRAGLAVLFAVAGFGLVTALFGLSQVFWFSLAMLVILGACDNISVVLRVTLVQVMTPDAMRGRVSALNSLFIGTSNELGALESGLAANFFGPVASVVSGGIGTIIVAAIVAYLSPQLRAYGRV